MATPSLISAIVFVTLIRSFFCSRSQYGSIDIKVSDIAWSFVLTHCLLTPFGNFSNRIGML